MQCFQVYNQSAMERIQLSKPLFESNVSVERAILNRRSLRDFINKPMSLDELSHLLYYSAGITDKRHGLRAAPSAGATYPIEIYPVINDVKMLSPGVYHYLVTTHELQLLNEGDFGHKVGEATLGQKFLAQANAVFLLSAVLHRTQQRYRERGQRYILIEAGHIAQNVCLVASAMGLGACSVGAFYDRDLNELLGLDGVKETTLYLTAVGKVQ